MKTIEAYQSADGCVYLTEREALEQDDNCIGEAIDALLSPAINACNGNVTRSDQYRMALYLLNNRKQLAEHVAILDKYLNKQGETE